VEDRHLARPVHEQIERHSGGCVTLCLVFAVTPGRVAVVFSGDDFDGHDQRAGGIEPDIGVEFIEGVVREVGDILVVGCRKGHGGHLERDQALHRADRVSQMVDDEGVAVERTGGVHDEFPVDDLGPDGVGQDLLDDLVQQVSGDAHADS